ncbi:hypothetical protein MRX96_012633 [Rhipicephalus microplus]
MIPGQTDAFSDKMIQYINYLNTTWKAGRNPGFEDPAYVRSLLGVHPENQRYRLPERRLDLSSLGPLPENFDSRENWPECTTNWRDSGPRFLWVMLGFWSRGGHVGPDLHSFSARRTEAGSPPFRR